MQCSDVMVRDVHTCRESQTIADCARLMRANNVGFVPIVDRDGNVLGTVTDRDLVIRALAEGAKPKTKVSEVMSKALVSCRADEDLAAVEQRMGEAKKSRILVLDGRRCVGVISLSDIAQREQDARSGALLRQVTRREVSATRPRA